MTHSFLRCYGPGPKLPLGTAVPIEMAGRRYGRDGGERSRDTSKNLLKAVSIRSLVSSELCEEMDRLPQRRQYGAIGQHDGVVEPLAPADNLTHGRCSFVDASGVGAPPADR